MRHYKETVHDEGSELLATLRFCSCSVTEGVQGQVGSLGNLIWWELSLSVTAVGTGWTLRSLATQTISRIVQNVILVHWIEVSSSGEKPYEVERGQESYTWRVYWYYLYQYRLVQVDLLERSSAEKYVDVLVATRLTMSQQYARLALKANGILEFIVKTVGTGCLRWSSSSTLSWWE